MRQILGAALLAAALAGCSIFGLNGLDEQRDRLEEAERRWARERPVEYSYTLSRLCFCGQEAMGPVRIRVRGDSVLSRAYVADGAPVPAQWAPLFGTMEDLFEVIETAIERDAHRLGVEYHTGLGYLVQADIDYEQNAVDEELSLRVAEFTSH